MKAYEKRVRSAMSLYWEMVEEFYTTPFMEIFFEPREKFNLVAAVNAALAGELEGGWAMRWRMRLFFLIVKLQARYPLVPRISFSEPDVYLASGSTGSQARSQAPMPTLLSAYPLSSPPANLCAPSTTNQRCNPEPSKSIS